MDTTTLWPNIKIQSDSGERAVAHLSLNNTEFRDQLYQCHPAWMRHGAPIDFILSDDLSEPDNPPYKLIIPAGPMTGKGREIIQKYLQKNDSLLGSAIGEFPPENFNAALPSFMERAGVHRYLEGNSNVWASSDLIQIQTPERRIHTLHFPQNRTVKELLSGDVLEIKNNRIERSFIEWDVQVFALRK